MSVQQNIDNSLVKTQIQMNFAAAGALNTDVLGAESTIGLTQFNILSPNIITDIQNVLDPAAGLVYNLFTRRLNNIRKQLGSTANFLTTFNGQSRPNMPIGLGSGMVQFVEQQAAGALAAQNYLITTVQPLAV
jgi:hypothetical protein